MDSNKSNIDSARIEFYENIEKLCCSPEVSAKDIARIICKAAEIWSNKNGIVLNDNYKSLLDFANSEYECDDEKIKHRFYKETNSFMRSIGIKSKQKNYPRPCDKQVRLFQGIRLRQIDDFFDDLV